MGADTLTRVEEAVEAVEEAVGVVEDLGTVTVEAEAEEGAEVSAMLSRRETATAEAVADSAMLKCLVDVYVIHHIAHFILLYYL
jgi:hypothetical protein